MENVWLKKVEEKAAEDVEKTLLGNKTDLDPQSREVSFNQGATFAGKRGMQFYEVSAKTGHNIEQAVYYLAKKIIEKKKHERRK